MANHGHAHRVSPEDAAVTRPAVPVSIRKAGQIHGHRLLLRNATRVDSSFIHSLRRHADRARYLSAVSPDPQEQLDWLDRYAEDKTQAYFVIADLASNTPLGTVRLYGARETAFSWGSWILQEAAGAHSAIESALMVYHYGLWLGFSSAYFEVMQANQSVWRFHERFGAQRVGAERDHFQYELSHAALLLSLRKYGRYLPAGIRVEA